MTQIIYNEGRVAGVSSYEEYVRQLKSVDPDFDVCTEREWLAASLASGSSMILKVRKDYITSSDSGPYVVQISLPSKCHISTANTITASYFYGECDIDSNGWATVVKSYGSSISNTSSSSPSNSVSSVTTSNVPLGSCSADLTVPTTDDLSSITYTTEQKRILQYSKIADGIVVQPGTWSKSGLAQPYKDFTPDLTKVPVIRLTFMEPITEDFYILFTGFSNRSVIRGISKFDFGATNTENKVDGDFLGPECYPWCSKIQFVSSPYMGYLNKESIRRGSRNVKVETYNDKPLIKITSNNLLNTKVYSHESNIGTGTGKDNFGNTITTWTGRAANSGSSWYNDTRTENVVSECTDSDMNASGAETVTTYSLNNPFDSSTALGFNVANNYNSDDVNKIKNGVHGGFYEITIDPYKLLKDLIDEIYARFAYYDRRLDEIEAEILEEINRRKKGDTFVLNSLYSQDDDTSLINLLNEVFSLIYNGSDTKPISIKSTQSVVDSYDDIGDSDNIKFYTTTLDWNYSPNTSLGKIARGNLNLYSGNSAGSSATNYIRTRSDNSNNDLWAK